MMTIISKLFTPYLANKLNEKWIIIISIILKLIGINLFFIPKKILNLFILAISFGLGDVSTSI